MFFFFVFLFFRLSSFIILLLFLLFCVLFLFFIVSRFYFSQCSLHYNKIIVIIVVNLIYFYILNRPWTYKINQNLFAFTILVILVLFYLLSYVYFVWEVLMRGTIRKKKEETIVYNRHRMYSNCIKPLLSHTTFKVCVQYDRI